MLWEQRVCLADTQKPHRDDPEGSAPSLMGMVLRSHLLALLQSPRCAVALQPSPHAPPAAVHDPQVNTPCPCMPNMVSSSSCMA